MNLRATVHALAATEASLMKLGVYQRIIVIYVYFKFHKILFSSYLVMVNFMDFKSIQWL